MKIAKNIIASIVMGSCMISAASYADTKPLMKIKPTNHIELLFFQQAKSGSIKPTSTGCYDLRLSGLNPNIMYFSNSPSKVAGNLTLAQFVVTMKHSEVAEKIKPNAVLNMQLEHHNKNQTVNIVGSLANANMINKQFHYTLCPFDENSMIKAGQIRAVNLFIDPIHRWPP